MKAFVILALALVSMSSFAQRGDRDDRNSGSITLRDGRNIVRIDVGDDRDDRDMLRRVRRLEQAVRDMQEQVYQLQAAPVRRSFHSCSGQFFTIGTLSARGATEGEARAALSQACQARGAHSMHCETAGSRNQVRCERGEE